MLGSKRHKVVTPNHSNSSTRKQPPISKTVAPRTSSRAHNSSQNDLVDKDKQQLSNGSVYNATSRIYATKSPSDSVIQVKSQQHRGKGIKSSKRNNIPSYQCKLRDQKPNQSPNTSSSAQSFSGLLMPQLSSFINILHSNNKSSSCNIDSHHSGSFFRSLSSQLGSLSPYSTFSHPIPKAKLQQLLTYMNGNHDIKTVSSFISNEGPLLSGIIDYMIPSISRSRTSTSSSQSPSPSPSQSIHKTLSTFVLSSSSFRKAAVRYHLNQYKQQQQQQQHQRQQLDSSPLVLPSSSPKLLPHSDTSPILSSSSSLHDLLPSSSSNMLTNKRGKSITKNKAISHEKMGKHLYRILTKLQRKYSTSSPSSPPRHTSSPLTTSPSPPFHPSNVPSWLRPPSAGHLPSSTSPSSLPLSSPILNAALQQLEQQSSLSLSSSLSSRKLNNTYDHDDTHSNQTTSQTSSSSSSRRSFFRIKRKRKHRNTLTGGEYINESGEKLSSGSWLRTFLLWLLGILLSLGGAASIAVSQDESLGRSASFWTLAFPIYLEYRSLMFTNSLQEQLTDFCAQYGVYYDPNMNNNEFDDDNNNELDNDNNLVLLRESDQLDNNNNIIDNIIDETENNNLITSPRELIYDKSIRELDLDVINGDDTDINTIINAEISNTALSSADSVDDETNDSIYNDINPLKENDDGVYIASESPGIIQLLHDTLIQQFPSLENDQINALQQKFMNLLMFNNNNDNTSLALDDIGIMLKDKFISTSDDAKIYIESILNNIDIDKLTYDNISQHLDNIIDKSGELYDTINNKYNTLFQQDYNIDNSITEHLKTLSHEQISKLVHIISPLINDFLIPVDPEEREEWKESQFNVLHQRHADNIFNIITSLRGYYIKLGQLGALRSDMLPPSWVEKLTLLQDNCPYEPLESLIPMIESEIGPIMDNFESINPIPLGAASIGQAHLAVLKNGEKVVLKLQYPDAKHMFTIDINTILDFCKLAQPEFVPILHEVKRQMMTEFDFLNEASNLSYAHHDLQQSEFKDLISIPQPYPELSNTHVLTMSYCDGIKIADKLTQSFKSLATEKGMTLKEFQDEYANTPPPTPGTLKALRAMHTIQDTAINTLKGLYNGTLGWVAPTLEYTRHVEPPDIRTIMHTLYDVHANQIFQGHLFNGDPHPGNILYLNNAEKTGKTIGLIDYGQAKSLSLTDRAVIAKMYQAWNNNDPEKASYGYMLLGYRTEHSYLGTYMAHSRLAMDYDSKETRLGMNVEQYYEYLSKNDPLRNQVDRVSISSHVAFLLRSLSQHLNYDLPSHQRFSKYGNMFLNTHPYLDQLVDNRINMVADAHKIAVKDALIKHNIKDDDDNRYGIERKQPYHVDMTSIDNISKEFYQLGAQYDKDNYNKYYPRIPEYEYAQMRRGGVIDTTTNNGTRSINNNKQ